jgi:CRISPR-associated helicase Cas3/CRISPR-associated endonuclease Cas3-HD
LPETQLGWQPLSTHLVNVAERARDFAEPLGLGEEAYLAGLLHDLGKYRIKFQLLLRGLEKAAPHAFAGSGVCLQQGGAGFMAASFAINGHHAGLPNGREDNKEKVERQEEAGGVPKDLLRTAIIDFHAWLEEGQGQQDSASEQLVQAALARLQNLASISPPLRSARKDALASEFLTRLLFSALVDADRLDTERFSEQHKAATREAYQRQALSIVELREKLDAFVAEKANAKQSNEVRALRESVRVACEKAALEPRGMFTLNVPTGGGKTLASVNFALRHAEKHGHQRVIVVEPYLSIIDQAAKELRGAFGQLAVLEHHSLSNASAAAARDESPGPLDLAAENWSAPVIVTTTVQFFESLFSNSPAPTRKLHRVANSVVIFDEVQNFPRHLLLPVLAMLQHYQKLAGSSLLFMSATLPDFAATVRDAINLGEYSGGSLDNKPIQATLKDFPNIQTISGESGSFTVSPRVQYDWNQTFSGPVTWLQLADAIEKQPQSLTIVNLKRHAFALCSELLQRKVRVLHLSTNLCPAHRRQVLRQAAEWLENKTSFALVATQCIEAGVDIDFPVLFRAVGPLDSIAQAAGRCNRHGTLGPWRGRVILFTPEDEGRAEDKKLPPSSIYRQGTELTRSQVFWGADLHKSDTFVRYYSRLFQLDSLDQPRRPEFKEQKINRDLRPKFKFADTAQAFQVIDAPTIAVFVGWDSRGHSIQRLKRLLRDNRFDPPRLARVLRLLRRFQVNLYEHEFKAYRSLFEEIIPDVFFTSGYHNEYGLNLSGKWPQDFV